MLGMHLEVRDAEIVDEPSLGSGKGLLLLFEIPAHVDCWNICGACGTAVTRGVD